MRKAVVRKSDGIVTNVIEIASKSEWKPPEGHKLLTESQSKTANAGDTWDVSKIVPQSPPEKTVERDLEAEIDQINERLEALER